MNQSWSSSKFSSQAADFDALAPSIVQCFFIVLGGYVSRKSDLLNESGLNGLRILMIYFLAPAMMMQSLMHLQWSSVNWKFVTCAFVAKSFVFVIVAFLTLLTSRDNLAKAGLFAIFTTQSNDMALGYPIAEALYAHSDHWHYPRYIYLLMPVSLLILNPIGYVMLEMDRRKNSVVQVSSSSSSQQSVVKLIFGVFLDVLRNPLVISSLIGLLGNVWFSPSGTPKMLDYILDGFSGGFTSVALFSLGCTLVFDKKSSDDELSTATALLLTLTKILLLPILLMSLISVTNIGSNSSETSSLTMFGFLYGSLPTAPTIYVVSSLFDSASNQIAISLAVCTFLAFPWLYFSCRMISIDQIPSLEQNGVLNFTSFHASIFGFLATVASLIMLIYSRKFRRLPHKYVFHFLLYSLFLTFTAFVIFSLPDSHRIYGVVIKCFQLAFEWGIRCTTVNLSISLLLLSRISLCRLLKYSKTLSFFGSAIPALLSCALLLFTVKSNMSPNAFDVYFERNVAIVCSILNALSLFISVVSLIWSSVIRRRYYDHSSLSSRTPYRLLRTTNACSSQASSNDSKSSKIYKKDNDHDDSGDDDVLMSQGSLKPNLTAAKNSTIFNDEHYHDQDTTTCNDDNVIGNDKYRLVNLGDDFGNDVEEDNSPSTAVQKHKPVIKLTDHAGNVSVRDRLRDIEEIVESDEEIDDVSKNYSRGNWKFGRSKFYVNDICPAGASCSLEQRQECKKQLQIYKRCVHNPAANSSRRPDQNFVTDVTFDEQDFELGTHSIFVTFLCFSTILNTFVCIWKISGVNPTNATFLQLKLLDAVVLYSQSAFCLWLFGDFSWLWRCLRSKLGLKDATS